MESVRWMTFLAVVSVALAVGLVACEGDDDGGGDDAASKIQGTWTVVSPWRWSRVTYQSNGRVDVVQRGDGKIFLRKALWRVEGNHMVVVSDITERIDFAVTDTTLRITLPDGTGIDMVRE